MEELRKKYEELFAEYEIPQTLKKLMDFEEEYGEETYSQSFCLLVEKDFYENYFDSEDEEDIKKYEKFIKVFASADGTGGVYAFWLSEGKQDLEQAPIVGYGSEGDIRIVAKNLKELLHLLSFDVEIADGCAYKDDEYYEESPNRPAFIKWLKKEFDIDPVEDEDAIEIIVDEAQEMYQYDFMEWHKQFEEIECEFNTAPIFIEKPVKDFNLQNIANLIYQPLDSAAVQETLSQLNCPSTAGKEKRDEFAIISEEIGLEFQFERIESEYNPDDKLILRLIIINYNCPYSLPFGLHFTDSLAQIGKKIGKPADYQFPDDEELRAWKLQNIAGQDYEFNITFEDSDNFIGIEKLTISD